MCFLVHGKLNLDGYQRKRANSPCHSGGMNQGDGCNVRLNIWRYFYDFSAACGLVCDENRVKGMGRPQLSSGCELQRPVQSENDGGIESETKGKSY